MANTTSTQTRSPKAKGPAKTAPKAAVRVRPDKARKATAGAEIAEAESRSTGLIGTEERETLIARAAYFRAERRGFVPGNELQDWYEAEAEVLQLVGGSIAGPADS